MVTYCISQLEADSPIQEIPVIELSPREEKAAEKIHMAKSEDEVVGIISDELVRSLMEQLSI
jgi:hypothetical protein